MQEIKSNQTKKENFWTKERKMPNIGNLAGNIGNLGESFDKAGAKLFHDRLNIGRFWEKNETLENIIITSGPGEKLIKNKENRVAFLDEVSRISKPKMWGQWARLKHIMENNEFTASQIINLVDKYSDFIGLDKNTKEQIISGLQDIAQAVTIAEERDEQLIIGKGLFAKSENDKMALVGVAASLIPGFGYVAAAIGTKNSIEDINRKSLEIKITQSIGELNFASLEDSILRQSKNSVIDQADYLKIRGSLEFLTGVCSSKEQRKKLIKILANLNRLQKQENSNKIDESIKNSLSEQVIRIKEIVEGSVSQKVFGQVKTSAEVIQSGINPFGRQIGNLCHRILKNGEKIEELSPEEVEKARVARQALILFVTRVAAPIAIANNREAIGHLVGNVFGEPVYAAEVPAFNESGFTASGVAQNAIQPPVEISQAEPKPNFIDGVAERFVPEIPKYGIKQTTLYQALAQNSGNIETAIKSYLSVNGLDPDNKALIWEIFKKLNNEQIVGSEGVNPEFLKNPQNLKKAMAEIAKIPELQGKIGLIDNINKFLAGQTPEAWDKAPANLANLTQAGQELAKNTKERSLKVAWLASSILVGAIANLSIGFFSKKASDGKDQFLSKRNQVGIAGSVLAGVLGGAGGVVAMTGVAIGSQVIGRNIKHAPKAIPTIQKIPEKFQQTLENLKNSGGISIEGEQEKLERYNTEIVSLNLSNEEKAELSGQKVELENLLEKLKTAQPPYVVETGETIEQKEQEYSTAKQDYQKAKEALEKEIREAEGGNQKGFNIFTVLKNFVGLNEENEYSYVPAAPQGQPQVGNGSVENSPVAFPWPPELQNPDTASEAREILRLKGEIQDTLNRIIGEKTLQERILGLRNNNGEVVQQKVNILQTKIDEVANGNKISCDVGYCLICVEGILIILKEKEDLGDHLKDLQTLAQAFKEMDEAESGESSSENSEQNVEMRNIFESNIQYKTDIFTQEKGEKAKTASETNEIIRNAESVCLGDAHGSSEKVLENLVLGGFVNMPKEAAEVYLLSIKQLQEIIKLDPFFQTEENKSKVREIYNTIIKCIKQMKWIGGDRKFIMIGDVLADRGELDGIISKIVSHLNNENGKYKENIITLTSNHDQEAIINTMNLSCIYTKDKSSHLRAKSVLENELLLEQYKEYMERVKLMYFDQENDILYTHAPITKNLVIKLLDEIKEIEYLNFPQEITYETLCSDKNSLINFIETINSYYTSVVKDSSQYAKFHDQGEILYKLVWNRNSLTDEYRLPFSGVIKTLVHGHDKSSKESPFHIGKSQADKGYNVVNLDQYCNKMGYDIDGNFLTNEKEDNILFIVPQTQTPPAEPNAEPIISGDY